MMMTTLASRTEIGAPSLGILSLGILSPISVRLASVVIINGSSSAAVEPNRCSGVSALQSLGPRGYRWPRVAGSPARKTGFSQPDAPQEVELREGETETPRATEHGASRRTPAIQIHNRYLIAESEDGVVVIDQHALHERILYEQIREKVLDGALESQNLLVPEPVDLSANEAAAVLDHGDLLAKLGVRVEPFGGETVLVSSYPAMLANMNPADVVRGLAEQLIADGSVPSPRDLLDELLHMISCKAAIKAGDRLTPEEVESLIEQRHLVQDSHHCPHGRPSTLVFTREELDRQFKRI